MKHPRSHGGERISFSLFFLVAALAATSCSSTTTPATGDLRLDLKHEDARVRIAATLGVVATERGDLVGLLVENLLDRDDAVRMFTSVGLRKLTGKDFGYNPNGTLTERLASVERWEEWLRSTPFQGQPSSPEQRSPNEKASSPPGSAAVLEEKRSSFESQPGAQDG